MPVEDAEIRVEPAALVRTATTHDDSCTTIETVTTGTVTVRFAGSIGGRASEAVQRVEIVEATHRAEWITEATPLLAGEPRENAPAGPREMHIETKMFGQHYAQDAALTL